MFSLNHSTIERVSIKAFWLGLIMMVLPISSNTQSNQPTVIPEQKKIVIKYDFNAEQCLQASTPDLHRITDHILYFKGEGNLQLLDEKGKEIIFIPAIKECELLFSEGTYYSGRFYLSPTNEWSDLRVVKDEIAKVRSLFLPLSNIALKEKKSNLDELSNEYFEKKMGEVINYYELDHYEIFLILNKFHIPRKIYPRDKDYFRLYFKVNKKEFF